MKTDAVRSTYSYNMKRFMDYLVQKKEISHNEEYDKLLRFDGERITDLLSGFIVYLNGNLKATAVAVMLAAPELFFTMNRKLWHNKLVRKTIKKNDHEPGGRLPATDEDIQAMLEVTKHVRNKAVIHFLASTGSILKSSVTFEDPTAVDLQEIMILAKKLEINNLYRGSSKS